MILCIARHTPARPILAIWSKTCMRVVERGDSGTLLTMGTCPLEITHHVRLTVYSEETHHDSSDSTLTQNFPPRATNIGPGVSIGNRKGDLSHPIARAPNKSVIIAMSGQSADNTISSRQAVNNSCPVVRRPKRFFNRL